MDYSKLKAIARAAWQHPRAALAVLNTLRLYWQGKLNSDPRGLAVTLHPRRIASLWICPWTKREYENVEVEDIVTFYLYPKYREIRFDAFEWPPPNDEGCGPSPYIAPRLEESEPFLVVQ